MLGEPKAIKEKARESGALEPLAYSVQQLAKAINVSPAYLWAEISQGNLESAKVGRRRLITAEQARRYLDRRVVKAEDQHPAPPPLKRQRECQAGPGRPLESASPPEENEIDYDKQDAAIERRLGQMALTSDDPQWAVAWALHIMGVKLVLSIDYLRDAIQQIADWDITLIGRAGE